jgi:hypothetical protein
MSYERPSKWKWFGLVAGLAVAHFIGVLIVEATLNPIFSRPRRPPVQPTWLYHVLIDVFLFPASVIFRVTRPGPTDGVFGLSVLMFTCLFWGCVWAEPFRRSYGWHPWRFSIRELLVVTTIVAATLGLLVALK